MRYQKIIFVCGILHVLFGASPSYALEQKVAQGRVPLVVAYEKNLLLYRTFIRALFIAFDEQISLDEIALIDFGGSRLAKVLKKYNEQMLLPKALRVKDFITLESIADELGISFDLSTPLVCLHNLKSIAENRYFKSWFDFQVKYTEKIEADNQTYYFLKSGGPPWEKAIAEKMTELEDFLLPIRHTDKAREWAVDFFLFIFPGLTQFYSTMQEDVKSDSFFSRVCVMEGQTFTQVFSKMVPSRLYFPPHLSGNRIKFNFPDTHSVYAYRLNSEREAALIGLLNHTKVFGYSSGLMGYINFDEALTREFDKAAQTTMQVPSISKIRVLCFDVALPLAAYRLLRGQEYLGEKVNREEIIDEVIKEAQNKSKIKSFFKLFRSGMIDNNLVIRDGKTLQYLFFKSCLQNPDMHAMIQFEATLGVPSIEELELREKINEDIQKENNQVFNYQEELAKNWSSTSSRQKKNKKKSAQIKKPLKKNSHKTSQTSAKDKKLEPKIRSSVQKEATKTSKNNQTKISPSSTKNKKRKRQKPHLPSSPLGDATASQALAEFQGTTMKPVTLKDDVEIYKEEFPNVFRKTKKIFGVVKSAFQGQSSARKIYKGGFKVPRSVASFGVSQEESAQIIEKLIIKRLGLQNELLCVEENWCLNRKIQLENVELWQERQEKIEDVKKLVADIRELLPEIDRYYSEERIDVIKSAIGRALASAWRLERFQLYSGVAYAFRQYEENKTLQSLAHVTALLQNADIEMAQIELNRLENSQRFFDIERMNFQRNLFADMKQLSDFIVELDSHIASLKGIHEQLLESFRSFDFQI